MFNQNGTYYTEEHSVSFGNVVGNTFLPYANSWTDWHLIPSSVPIINIPQVNFKFIDIPGTDDPIDLTEYLTGTNSCLGMRSGSFPFIVDNDHEDWESIRMKIANILHGSMLYVRLEDDPTHAFKGRFTLDTWNSGADHSSINIQYELFPETYTVSSS